MLFVYNCNPLATMPDQNRVLEGLKRDDLFTVVYEQVFTDTARYADVVLPATTFLENYDIAKGYGPISLQLVRPVDRAASARRAPNAEVFSRSGERGSARRAGGGDRYAAARRRRLPPQIGRRAARERRRDAAVRRRADPVRRRVSADAGSEDRPVPGRAGRRGAGRTLRLPARSRRRAVPARAHFAGQREDRVVHARRAAPASGACCRCIPPMRGRAALATDDPVRVFNDLGEVQCPVALNPDIRPGTISLPKGLWRKSTYNGSTSNALVPDSLTDLGGGACFNDARVQVASLGKH